jgi:hypothetical protein
MLISDKEKDNACGNTLSIHAMAEEIKEKLNSEL